MTRALFTLADGRRVCLPTRPIYLVIDDGQFRNSVHISQLSPDEINRLAERWKAALTEEYNELRRKDG